MINKTLMKQTIKSNITLWIILTVVQSFILGSMIMGSGGKITVVMTSMFYYNMLPGLITAIYICVTANKLIASQVDKGTMAYILSTPVKRSKVALTQATFFIGALFFMFSICSLAHIISHFVSAGSISGKDIGMILLMNLGLFLLDLALSGICYLASCYFNLSKNVIAVGGGIVGAFHLLSMVGAMVSSLSWLKSLTLVTLLDFGSITSSSMDFIWKFIILALVGGITYTLGVILFTKRDLPL